MIALNQRRYSNDVTVTSSICTDSSFVDVRYLHSLRRRCTSMTPTPIIQQQLACTMIPGLGSSLQNLVVSLTRVTIFDATFDSLRIVVNRLQSIACFLVSGFVFVLQIYEYVREKTKHLGFRPGLTRTDLYSHRSRLEISDLRRREIVLSV